MKNNWGGGCIFYSLPPATGRLSKLLIKRVAKKTDVFQADRNRLTPHPPYGQFFVNFCGVFYLCQHLLGPCWRVSESVIHVFEILSNLGHIFRVCSEYVQSMFRVCSENVQSMF